MDWWGPGGRESVQLGHEDSDLLGKRQCTMEGSCVSSVVAQWLIEWKRKRKKKFMMPPLESQLTPVVDYGHMLLVLGLGTCHLLCVWRITCTRLGVCVGREQLWDPLRTRAILERLGGVFTTRRYTNTRFPYFTLPYLTLPIEWSFIRRRRWRVVTSCSFLDIVYISRVLTYLFTQSIMGEWDSYLCIGEDRHEALGNWQDQLPANSNGK